MNARIADNVGTPQLKQFLMVSIKEFPRGILDQVISKEPATAGNQRAPGPGQSQANKGLIHRRQASSSKRQATSSQASSDKHQAPSYKRQASSRKQQAL
jgi:hypothetical protein